MPHSFATSSPTCSSNGSITTENCPICVNRRAASVTPRTSSPERRISGAAVASSSSSTTGTSLTHPASPLTELGSSPRCSTCSISTGPHNSSSSCISISSPSDSITTEHAVTAETNAQTQQHQADALADNMLNKDLRYYDPITRWIVKAERYVVRSLFGDHHVPFSTRAAEAFTEGDETETYNTTGSIFHSLCGYGVVQKLILFSDWKKAKQMVLINRYATGKTSVNRDTRIETLRSKIKEARLCLQAKASKLEHETDEFYRVQIEASLREEREEIQRLESELHQLHQPAHPRLSRLKHIRKKVWDFIRGRTRRKINKRVWTDLDAQDRNYVKSLIMDFGYLLSAFNVSATRLERTLVLLGANFGLDLEIQATPTFLMVSFHDCFLDEMAKRVVERNHNANSTDIAELEKKIADLIQSVQNYHRHHRSENGDTPTSSNRRGYSGFASVPVPATTLKNIHKKFLKIKKSDSKSKLSSHHSQSPYSAGISSEETPAESDFDTDTVSARSSYNDLLEQLHVEDELEEVLEEVLSDNDDVDSIVVETDRAAPITPKYSATDRPSSSRPAEYSTPHTPALSSLRQRRSMRRSLSPIETPGAESPTPRISPNTPALLSTREGNHSPVAGRSPAPATEIEDPSRKVTPGDPSTPVSASSSTASPFSIEGDGDSDEPIQLHPNSPEINVNSKYEKERSASGRSSDVAAAIVDDPLLPSENYLVCNTTHMVNIPNQAMHLTKLIYLESLAEQIQSGEVPLRRARQELRRILKMKWWTECFMLPHIARVVGTVSLCVLLDGNKVEIAAAATAAVVIVILKLLTTWSSSLQKFLQEIASLVGGLVALAYKIGFLDSDYSVNTILVAISSMIGFLSGYAITQAFAELSDRKIQAGILRLMDAIIKVFKLSFGVLIASSLEKILFPNNYSVLDSNYTNPAWSYALAIAGAIFTYIINFRGPFFFLSTFFSLCAGYVAFFGTNYLQEYVGMELATLGGATAVGLFGEGYARLSGHPSVVVSSVSLLLLVPGSLPVRSQVALLINNDVSIALQLLFQTGVIAIALIIGLTISKIILPSHRILEY